MFRTKLLRSVAIASGLLAALPTAQSQEKRYETSSFAYGCATFSGANDVFDMIAQKPDGILIKDWVKRIECVSLPVGWTVVRLEEVRTIIRGLLVTPEKKTFELYFPSTSVRETTGR